MSQTTEAITVVMPLADHQGVLAKTLDSWLAVLEELTHPYEMLLVLDGCTDETPRIAAKYAEKHATIRVLTHEQRRGFGACLRTAFDASTHPLFFYTSCDPYWNPKDLPRLLKSIYITDEYTGKQVDVANGHRRGVELPPSKKARNYWRRLLTRVLFGYWPEAPKGWLGKEEDAFWWSCRLRFGLRLGDINSSFKLFRRRVLDRIVIQSDGDFVHAELLAKANFLGSMMDEVVLADRQPLGTVPNTKAERRAVFNHPQFRSPDATPAPAPSV